MVAGQHLVQGALLSVLLPLQELHNIVRRACDGRTPLRLVHHHAAFNLQARGPDNGPDGCGGKHIQGLAQAVRPAHQIEEEAVLGAAVRMPCLIRRGGSCRSGLGRTMARALPHM
ncbi:hypothetical protein GCM10007175_14800 [Pseudarthrobacter scleromae]|uniref:Uncharacterized protein n=1 Tax=Pseudarthrobacter scleromae TaxID=158897 RepID=A0ABQ2CH41_9MICC|nr:hypothetical protein GCM10007175_14800 [Pseudarthrobacter scleromae]